MTVCGLGIDAGGTATRWALAEPGGHILAEGQVDGMSGRVATAEERRHVERSLSALAEAVRQYAAPSHVVAGITSYDAHAPDGNPFQDTLASALGLSTEDLVICDDLLMSYLGALAPGDGYLVYAGTGSMSVFVDAQGVLFRVGGRGVVLDDGGGGFWITRQALQGIWRREEETPQAWRSSAMARRLFAALGSHEWPATRQFVYGSARGDIGRLAVEVAASAQEDALARAVLADAGRELARLANVQLRRHGPRPVVLAGGVATLHALIGEAMREALRADVPLTVQALQSHRNAARLAAQGRGKLAALRRIRTGE